MSAYSEHVKNAQREIDGVHEWQEREGETDATLLASTGIAQAEATLALAEQQSIANLIALATTIPDDRDGDGDAVDEMRAAACARLTRWIPGARAEQGHYRVRPEIAEALGIKTGDNK